MKKRKKITEFVVDVATWYRGMGFRGTSALVVNENNNITMKKRPMCCLGHLGVACGQSRNSMFGAGMPEDILTRLVPEFKRLMLDPDGIQKNIVSDIALINDNYNITDIIRKRRLRIKFRQLGLKVRFV